MTKSVFVGKFYKILPIFEGSVRMNDNNYCNYMRRLSVYCKGLHDNEIFIPVEGLREFGMDIDHETVKANVLHLISVADKFYDERNGVI